MSVVRFADLIARGALLVSDGYRTKASEHGQPGYPILRVAEVLDGALRPQSGDHVRAEFKSKIGPKLSQPGDVLLTTKGTVGRRAIMPSAVPAFVYSPQLCFFRTLDEEIDRRWLYYWLGSDAFWSQANGISQQTDMAAYISLRDLRQVAVDLPPIETQRGIAATLGVLDDKLESNLRSAQIATELAIAYFSEGERRVRIGDVATIARGLSYKGSGLAAEGGAARPMLNLANFTTVGRCRMDGLKYYRGAFKEEHQLTQGELLVANTDLTQAREILGRGFLVPPSLDGAIHSHHTSAVRFGEKDDWMRPYLWAQLQSVPFRARAMGFATGTTVAALPTEALLDYEFLVPNADASDLAAAKLLDFTWHAEGESAKLSALRDVLLPELFSGRIRVPEAEIVAADATT